MKELKIKPRKLVCIFAHPDDEAFGPGGTIASFAREAEVYLVCVTNGDADKKFTGGNVSGKELGKIRREELSCSAKTLGVKTVTFLNFKDGSLCNNNYHDVADDLKKILDKIKPDSLLTYYIDGVSGHLDHVAVAMETSYLFERLKYVKNLFYFCQNAKLKKFIGNHYFVYHPAGFTESEVDWNHDISDFYKTKIESIKCHKSQIKDFAFIRTFFGRMLKVEMFKIISK